MGTNEIILIRKLLKMFIFKDTIGKYIEVSGIGGKI